MITVKLDLADAGLLVKILRAEARSHSARMGRYTSLMSGNPRNQSEYKHLREVERAAAQRCRELAGYIEGLMEVGGE